MLKKIFLLATAAACIGCGGDPKEVDLVPPTDCMPGRLTYVHNLRIGHTVNGSGNMDADVYVFENATATSSGRVDLSSSFSTTHALLTFTETVANGGAGVAAHGLFEMDGPGIAVGNCDSDAATSTLNMNADGLGGTFILRELHLHPYCGGDNVIGQVAACFRQ